MSHITIAARDSAGRVHQFRVPTEGVEITQELIDGLRGDAAGEIKNQQAEARVVLAGIPGGKA